MKRAAVIALSFVACGVARGDDRQSFERIEHGRYLTVLGDCAGCHTAPGEKPFAGGLTLATPFGPLVSPNITPDGKTGIGDWTDDQFVAAVRAGVAHSGAHLYPAMPYPYYARMTRADVLAMRDYLATIEPVRHDVVSNRLPFPFDIRAVVGVWNWWNFKPGVFEPDAKKSAEWNRGAWIVQGPGHCGACHTTKNFMGGDERSARLQGGVLQGWYAPDITNEARRGLGHWSVDDIIQYLKTGGNRWTLASGPMGEAIADSTSKMTDADLKAIAVYLKDYGAEGASAASAAPSQGVMRAGAAIYKDRCSACHKEDGSGESMLFPKLAGSALVQSKDATTVTHMVLEGSRAVATGGAPTAPAMPPFGWTLDDAQTAAVVTYIRNAWGNSAPAVDAGFVRKRRANRQAGG